MRALQAQGSKVVYMFLRVRKKKGILHELVQFKRDEHQAYTKHAMTYKASLLFLSFFS
jgi:hypothetical protein